MTVRSLLLCSRAPWPPVGGDRLRTHQLAQVLAQLGPVHLVSGGASEPPEGHPFASIRDVGPGLAGLGGATRALVRGDSLQEAAYAWPSAKAATQEAIAGGVDVVVAHLIRTVGWVPDPSPPLVVCVQDALSAQARAAGRAPGRAGGWRRAALAVDRARLPQAERRAMARADAVTFITQADLDELGSAGARAIVVPAGVDLGGFAPGIPVAGRIVFAGNLRTAANQDMARELATVILPAVRRQRPEAHLDLIGVDAPRAVAALGSLAGVRYLGPVPSMAVELATAWVTACPSRFGSGVQNKVLESLATGVPVIATPRVAASLQTPCEAVLVGEAPDALARHLIDLLADAPRRDALGAIGRRYIAGHHRFPQCFAPLAELVRDLAGRGLKAR